MKKFYFVPLCFMLICACNNNDDSDTPSDKDYKQEMRNFVIKISQFAKAAKPGFIIIPQNGVELITSNGKENGLADTTYLNAIDGNGQEDLFYGYDNDDKATSVSNTAYLSSFLNISRSVDKLILITDYCSTVSNVYSSYTKNNTANFISFAANHRELDVIPNYPSPIFAENNKIVSRYSDVKNFLYLINPEKFPSKADFISAITSTNYDLLIMDYFFHEGTEFTVSEIDQLKNKANGGKRLVLSYMSIGEAENYRYYWQSSWNSKKPSWIAGENPDWDGNFKVKFWEKEWQNIVFGNDNAYLNKIIHANFDGVYLDIIDAFEYFE